MQIICETAVGKADDPVGVRVATRVERGPGGAALRRGAEAVFKLDSGPGESIDVRGADMRRPITAKMLAEVMAEDDQDVGLGWWHNGISILGRHPGIEPDGLQNLLFELPGGQAFDVSWKVVLPSARRLFQLFL
jgi:hypothetical protein